MLPVEVGPRNRASKLPALDGLRALSILLVILGHAKNTIGAPAFLRWRFFPSANLGVTIFFVISGYLITTLLLREKERSGTIDLRAFYARRSLRIFPVFLLFLGVVAVLQAPLDLLIPKAAWIGALTYTTNFVTGAGGSWWLGHSWSLGVEEQFYLTWPLAARASRRVMVVVAVALVVLGPISRLLYLLAPQVTKWSLAPFFVHADSIMFGCLGAALPEAKAARLAGFLRRDAGLVLLAAAVLFLDRLATTNLVLVLFPLGQTVTAALVCWAIVALVRRTDGLLSKTLNLPLVVAVGTLSYSLYVWQQLFLPDANRAVAHPWWQAFPLNVLLVVLAAVVSYRFWERPFLRLKERRFS